MAESGEERDLIAAERALGLAAHTGESGAEAAARERWERRFAALAEALAPVAPPKGLFAAIASRIDAEDARAALARAERRARRWRGVSVVTGALAAGLGLFIAHDGLQEPAPERYVAIVYADADPSEHGMIVEFDAVTGVATVIPLLAAAPEGRDFEMWHLPVGAERPRSIGLLPETPHLRRELTAGPGDVFAISLEQAGGSPSGQPTMALYHGSAAAASE
ncbi:MAG: anti-sigma factor [Pseudomonadota bacterium]